MEDSVYRVSVKALILDDKKRVLMMSYTAGLWGLPGGGVEHGEDPRAALVRECQEELGIAITNVGNSPVYVGTEDLTGTVWSCKLLYTASWSGNEEFTFEHDIKAAEFLSISDMENRGLVGSGSFALDYLKGL